LPDRWMSNENSDCELRNYKFTRTPIGVSARRQCYQSKRRNAGHDQ
jgi:hypothetical protein